MIPISRLRKLLRYDPATGFLYWTHLCPSSRHRNKLAGTLNNLGYIRLIIDGRYCLSHRVIWAMQTGNWPSCEIDHKNNHRADNRWHNLREASDAEQARNRNPHSNRKTRYKGVYRLTDKPRKRPYGAAIWVNGRQKHLGTFPTEEAASAAYQAATIEHFGEFARFE